MPVQVSYPGVYIEELPSGDHVIAGVETSTTAFIGRAAKGLVDEPTIVLSFGDFETLFGGLDPKYPMSYAVHDFFMNGGFKAIIVRLYKDPDSASATAGLSIDSVGQQNNSDVIKLVAMDPGAWGGYLEASVDYDGITTAIAKQYEADGLVQSDLFNLNVTYHNPNGAPTQERFTNVTLKIAPDGEPPLPNQLDEVLKEQSMLVRLQHYEDHPLPKNPPPDGAVGKAIGGKDSDPLEAEDFIGDKTLKTGLYALDKVKIFNILCIPPDQTTPIWKDIDELVWQTASIYCMERKAFLICDPPTAWMAHIHQGQLSAIDPMDLGIVGESARYSAVYFPMVEEEDLLMNGKVRRFPICGIIAGIMARTDIERGVWKAPAGLEASILGIKKLEYNLTDAQNGILNPQGINATRFFDPGGLVVWGARTLRGQDALSDDYKYVPVRRLVNYMELSLKEGTQWAVFEPNDETLWSALQVSIDGFMGELMSQGAFYQYKVACNDKTTTPRDIEMGIVKVHISFAPVKPAEFVILQFQIEGLEAG